LTHLCRSHPCGSIRRGELAIVLEEILNHGFETRSLPRSLAATRRGFAFYVADPLSSIETRSLPASLAATFAALP
jgi:hypothetical protein